MCDCEQLEPDAVWVKLPYPLGYIVTNSATCMAAGVAFVALETRDSERLCWWAVERLENDTGQCKKMLKTLADMAASDTTLKNPNSETNQGKEHIIHIPNGNIRIADTWDKIRVCDLKGQETNLTDTNWDADEIANDPQLVWGAILGAACQLAAYV